MVFKPVLQAPLPSTFCMSPLSDARISGCLEDISAWMKEHHLQLNLAKTELLVFPVTPTLQHDFTIQIDSATSTPSSSVRNLVVIFNDRLPFKEHIAKTARSCWFAFHNIRKIRPFLFTARCTTSCLGPCHF